MSEKTRVIGLSGLIKESGEKIVSGVADVAKTVSKTVKGAYTPTGTAKKARKITGKGARKSSPPRRKP